MYTATFEGNKPSVEIKLEPWAKCPNICKGYGKCPKNSNTKASDKMIHVYANSVDPDQSGAEGAVWSGSTLFVIPLNI